ncbi:MAG TPA: TonB-dependent receptor, partial [Gemmatimonadales bacterium]|nr:TonB-dependent receptor [Gemmatimonadales bacterium]
DTNQFIDDRVATLSLDGGRRVSDRLELRILGGWFDARRDFDDRRDTPADTLGFGFEQFRHVAARRWLADLRVLARPFDQVRVSLGVERSAERERTRSTTRSDFGTGAFTDQSEFHRDRGNTATYGQVLAALGSRVDLQAGIRHDANEVFGGLTTWQSGVVARPAPAIRLRASVGTAFKQPTFSEQFADTPFEVGNPDLVPERTRSWEAGAEGMAWDGRISLTATWFSQRFRDLIQYQAGAPGEPTYANVARARADGVELGASAALARGWSLTARYTWLNTDVEDAGGTGSTAFAEAEPLLRRPAHVWGAGLTWTLEGAGSYTLQVQRTGSRMDVDFREFPSPRVTLAGYTLVDASVDLPLAAILGAGGWRSAVGLTLSGQNLLDSEYESVVGFAARGRMVLVGIRAAP